MRRVKTFGLVASLSLVRASALGAVPDDGVNFDRDIPSIPSNNFTWLREVPHAQIRPDHAR